MNLRQNWSRSKEVLGAYFRQGLKELGSVFYGHGTAAQPAEYGMVATKTPGEVADGLRGTIRQSDRQQADAPSLLSERLDSLRDRQPAEKEIERPEPERE